VLTHGVSIRCSAGENTKEIQRRFKNVKLPHRVF
jgi:hypothetical protein